MSEHQLPLIAIAGPTASGKTGLAIELAERYDGEIICADSRTIYRGMDIGTAKPTLDEQKRVRHHMLDVVQPGDRFTVKDFQAQAMEAIRDIRARNKVPFLVGGTGLYINSVVLNYTFSDANATTKQLYSDEVLENSSIEDLHEMLKKHRISMPSDPKNKRRLVAAIQRANNSITIDTAVIPNTYVVCITTEKAELLKRVEQRAEQMFASGVIEEASQLGAKYGWGSEAMTGNIYPILRRFIDGEITKQDAIELSVIRDRQLIKKQLTWFKKQNFMHKCSLEQADVYIEKILC